MPPDLDKLVKELRKEREAEKAERRELLEELRRSRGGGDEPALSPRERLRRGVADAEAERKGGDDDGDDQD